jgi:hypothetical protein
MIVSKYQRRFGDDARHADACAVGSLSTGTYDVVMKAVLSMATALTLLTSVAAAQDTDFERCGELPAAVAKTRDEIRSVAAKGDLAALAGLTDPARFTYSFGDGGDPAAYWESLKGEGTDVGAIIVALLDMTCVAFEIEGDATYYEWPAAAEMAYEFLTEEEIAALDNLYGGKLEEQYIEGSEVGYYAGWRLLIAEDGRWDTFVAGD